MQNGRFIDITPKNVDKSTGIARLAEIMNVSFNNIWVTGDNYNDISMLKSYHGCAMSGGVEEATQAAELVYDNVGNLIQHILGNI